MARLTQDFSAGLLPSREDVRHSELADLLSDQTAALKRLTEAVDALSQSLEGQTLGGNGEV